MPRLGVVVIGRNEGERLRRCLTALGERITTTVYVDSGSTDASVTFARSLGAEVVDLDMHEPFTAARARNAGFEQLRDRFPDVEFVQFVDGDCELAPGWLSMAEKALDERPKAAAVFGRLRERHPEATVFNRLCDIEWNSAIPGEVKACGGNAMMRVSALHQVGGFDPDVLAAEDDELCLRLRRAGWSIHRIDVEMGWHDAAMTRLNQWWTRMVRSGYAYAQGAAMHGSGPERHFVRERARILLWGALVPAIIVVLAWPTRGWSLLALLLYALQWAKVTVATRRRGESIGASCAYGLSCVAGKIPQSIGIARFVVKSLRRQPARLIEYK